MPQILTAGPAAPPVTLRLTPETYFKWEQAQELKPDYIHGEVFPRAGATRGHTVISGNLLVTLAIAGAEG